MNAILHIIKKELLQLRRDPKMFGIIFIAPVLQLLILGYAANLDVRDIQVVVCDQDKSATSREFIRQFTNSGYFTVMAYVPEIDEVDRYLDYSKANMALVIPLKFGSDVISRARPAQVQAIVDGSEPMLTTAGMQYATIIANSYAQNVVFAVFDKYKGSALRIPRVSPELRIWYNPELKSRNFMIPGVLATLLMILTMLLTSLAIVKEKEVGTMEQLIVTPIKPYALIIGKIAPFVGIGIIDICIALLVATFWFKVHINGSLWLLFGLCVIFLMTTLGLGLFISTISKTQQQAMMTSAFFVIMPMIYLSGFAFPIENMPQAIQYVTYLFPLRYFIIIIRGVYLKGVGIQALWGNALTLFLFGVVILTVSILRFSKKVG